MWRAGSVAACASWLCVIAAATPPAGRTGSCAGIASADQLACCPALCGTCGGPDCTTSPGGAHFCCTDKLLESAPPCGPKDTGPCLLPEPIPAGKKRCTPVLGHDLHYEACEPSCAGSAAAPGSKPASCTQCRCKACRSCAPLPPPPPPPDYYTRFTTDPDPLGCSFQVSIDSKQTPVLKVARARSTSISQTRPWPLPPSLPRSSTFSPSYFR